jgi:hypothetical protein
VSKLERSLIGADLNTSLSAIFLNIIFLACAVIFPEELDAEESDLPPGEVPPLSLEIAPWA